MPSLLLFLAAFLARVHSLSMPAYDSSSCVDAPATVDADHFATSSEIRFITEKICGSGLRLPGSPNHLKIVDDIECQLNWIPGITTTRSEFELANWQPVNNSIYQAAHLTIDGQAVDVVGAIAYSLPTNGSSISGQLMYADASANLSTMDLKGKIIVRDYPLLSIPTQLFSSIAYYASPDSTATPTYTRPFLTPPNADLLAASLGGAAGYISAFNVSRKQLEGYYTSHAGTHWLVPGVFTGAEQYPALIQAAHRNASASIRIDAESGTVRVPRLHATLPGTSNETIVLATHTDGATYVQENGPAALITLARYFASLPISSRRKTLKFTFEASHLAYQKDSDKLLALSLDSSYDEPNDPTSFVVAIEHLGAREILPSPAPEGVPGEVLDFTGRGEALLWAVGPVRPAIESVVRIAKARNLDNTIVAPGFPPANPEGMVPDYPNMGGLGTYYTNALVPTMALISGPWSLWAPGFGAAAVDYERLRLQHIAIGDAVLALSGYGKGELEGNYTVFREERKQGAKTSAINTDDAQFITGPEGVYY